MEYPSSEWARENVSAFQSIKITARRNEYKEIEFWWKVLMAALNEHGLLRFSYIVCSDVSSVVSSDDKL